MVKVIRKFFYFVFCLLCFWVAGYAFYYLSQSVNPHNSMAMKFANAGLEIPAHFFGAGLALLLVPFQLSEKLRKYSKNTHKTIGYIYVVAIIFGSISGFIMSFNATGGAVAEWGFRLLSVFWLITMVKAVTYAMDGKIKLHKKWIYRSIAFTSSAITLRIFLGVGLGVLHLPFLTVYVSTAWLCWVFNLIICEIMIYQRQPKQQLAMT